MSAVPSGGYAGSPLAASFGDHQRPATEDDLLPGIVAYPAIG